MQASGILGYARLAAAILILTAFALPVKAQTSLYTQGRVFNLSDHIVSASVFHWYTADDGQWSGPWEPLDGRWNWTGTSTWWQSQIKQMMMANIDVMWVHLIPHFETQRINLFTALNQLRSQGYDVPKVAPFLDPVITWDGMPLISLATTTGKDTFVGEYTRFFQQYYSANQDTHADTYIEQIDGQVVLDTWHVKGNFSNLSSLTRDDVESRLRAAFYPAHPVFNNGIRMVTNAENVPQLSFADEKVSQFEFNTYKYEKSFTNTRVPAETVRSVQLKAGFWNQNIGGTLFLPRTGGTPYKTAWNAVNRATTTRAYIESWNEYDEGSGIYAALGGPPYRAAGVTNTDTWSSTNDPYEYIRTTATGAASFNDTPALGARPLWNNIPTSMRAGSTVSVRAIMRNDGDLSWNNASGVRFGQDRSADPTVFCASDRTIVDSTNEIPTYGGIFRGRPIEFNFDVTAPAAAGSYATHWGMAGSDGARFGEQAAVTIQVTGSPVPVGPTPTDIGFATKTASIRFSWAAVVDPTAGTAGYNCRVGTTPGGSNKFSGYVGNVLSKTVTGANGQTYYCQVQVVANDGCVGPWSNASDGIMLDMTAPPAASIPVDAGLYSGTSVTFTWAPVQDAASGTASYFCQIGTTVGGQDVFNGDVGNVLSRTVTVTPRRTCYCRVYAKDVAGNFGSWSGSSDGVAVVDVADESVGVAKAYPDGTWVGLTLPVSAAFMGTFYVEELNRISGIAVVSPALVWAGELVQVYGTLGTANGERAISALGLRAM